jgi:hypothetical protein
LWAAFIIIIYKYTQYIALQKNETKKLVNGNELEIVFLLTNMIGSITKKNKGDEPFKKIMEDIEEIKKMMNDSWSM